MSFNWRDLPADILEQHFNPRVACHDAAERIEGFMAQAARAREGMPGLYDLRFGDGEKETLDVHAPAGVDGSAPLVLFIHGGYWRGLDKQDHSFVAPPWMATGAVVANVNYDLAPVITLDEMVEEMVRAVRFCHEHAGDWGADGNALYLVGHSAGAHLSAEMLLRDWGDDPAGSAIRGVAALTGIYEPEIILGVSVNEEAQVSADVAKRRSCLDRPFHLQPQMVVAVGGDEPDGWRGQSAAFADRCRSEGLHTEQMEVPGGNHFTALEAALEPGDPLHTAVTGLWQR